MAHEHQQNQVPLWTKSERISLNKPSWQIARDISMDILSRKVTRLSLKQGRFHTSFFQLLTSNKRFI